MLWPGLPSNSVALAMQYQLEQSQWWSAGQLEQHQLNQLSHLLRHACQQIPFWRERLAGAGYDPKGQLTSEWLSTVPLLDRHDIQTLGDSLLCQEVPRGHGRVTKGETSGSTGRPIVYYGTELTQFLWRVYTLRDHLWHRRDLSVTLASIRKGAGETVNRGWGPSTDVVFNTGRCLGFDIKNDIDTQLRWLQRQEPDYLITNAYNLYWLARRSLELGLRIPNLRQARSFGGTFPDDARDVIRRAWGVALVDIYTSEEAGYIALQCPEHEHYHAQSENLMVEILDDQGRACSPGEIGRVVLTRLHNYAMPLFRYVIGDYAEAGASCPCGRGLPVINRILGRQRNILTLPDGRRRWPSFPGGKWMHVAPIRQLQLIQRSRTRIDVRVAADRELAREEKQRLIAALQDCLGHPFEMQVEQFPDIPRSATHKFEDFISEIV
jgi:phenylacetate-CoA ligase